MSAPDATAELRAAIEVDDGHWYLLDPETIQDDIGRLGVDPVGDAESWKRRPTAEWPWTPCLNLVQPEQFQLPVDLVGDADEALYQRWPDDGPGPSG